jgi:succinyl-diaminopimelate desuccinylase
MNEIRNQLLARIDADRDTIVEFLRGFLRCKSPNPPGDTAAAAQYVGAFLERSGLSYKRVAPKADRPNIVATTNFRKPGRHLVLNGHIDVFPVGVESEWKHDPWGGELEDGRIYGRGACDMKCGTTASIFTYAYLSSLQDQLHGRLTLTAVSDEETFGPWGARYLMEHHAEEVLGDCCLNGEPSSLHSTRFGEKGPLWLKFRVATRGGHAAYVHTSKNAIAIAMAVMNELQSMAGQRADEPPAVTQALDAAHDALEKAYGKGAAKTVREVTVNFGAIRGGTKVNMIAADCEFEVDVRAPHTLSECPRD